MAIKMSKNIYQGRKILVTGASSGIGLEFARILKGYDCTLILTASRPESLKKIESSFLERSAAKIFCFRIDLREIDNIRIFYQKLADKDLIPDILINNAGQQSYGYFHKLDWQREYGQVILNCIAPIYLIHLILPWMIKNNFGRILNVGSVAGTMPGPFFATYAATKSFLNSFSQSINQEMHNKNVRCACLLPGNTNSKNFWDLPKLKEKIGNTSRFASPQDVARYGLMLLEKDRDYGVYGFYNKTKQFIKRFVPRQLLNYALRKHTYNKLLED